jgi:chemotaxis protein MotB
MRKLIFLLVCTALVSSCVSKKEYASLQAQHKKTKDELVAVKNSLTKCTIEKEKCESKSMNLESTVEELKKDKQKTLEYVDNLTVLTQGANENIRETLTQLSKKDKYINRIRAAASKKDSLNLVVAFHLKKELKDGIDDEDIEINVEKTVVFISISDKLLFKSGSYNITDKAYDVLEKVATVVNGQPEMDVMIEGHTDDTPVKADNKVLQDNWDLSVKRATAITRVLQYKYGVQPNRLIAAGRSSYIPLAPNDTPANKSKNRRTKIIILPKIGQFFDLLEQKAE